MVLKDLKDRGVVIAMACVPVFGVSSHQDLGKEGCVRGGQSSGALLS